MLGTGQLAGTVGELVLVLAGGSGVGEGAAGGCWGRVSVSGSAEVSQRFTRWKGFHRTVPYLLLLNVAVLGANLGVWRVGCLSCWAVHRLGEQRC